MKLDGWIERLYLSIETDDKEKKTNQKLIIVNQIEEEKKSIYMRPVKALWASANCCSKLWMRCS